MHLHLCDTIALMTPASWHVFSRRLGALVVFVLLAFGAWAWTPDSTAHRNHLESRGELESWNNGGQSPVAFVTLNGARISVSLVSGSRRFGRGASTIMREWGEDSGYWNARGGLGDRSGQSLVTFTATGAHYGRVKFEQTLNFDVFFKRFGFNVVYLRTSKGLNLQGENGRSLSPDSADGKFNYYTMISSDTAPSLVRVKSRDETPAMVLYWALAFIFCVPGLIAKFVGEYAASKRGWNTFEARAVYAEGYQKALTFLLVICAVLLAATVISGVFDQLIGLQGDVFANLLPIGTLTGSFVAGFGTRNYWMLTSRRVFSVNSQESGEWVGSKARSQIVLPGKLSKHYQWFLFSGLLLWLPILWAYPWQGTFFVWASFGLISLVLCLIWFIVASMISRYKAKDPEVQAILQQAQEIVSSTQSTQDKRHPKLVVLKASFWSRHFVMVSDKRILFTPEVITELTKGESLFLLTHLAAHLRLGQDTKRVQVILLWAVLAMVAAPLLTIILFTGLVPNSVLQLLWAGYFCSLALIIEWLYTKQVFESDEYAFRMTNDLISAESALKKLSLGSELPGLQYVNPMGTTPPIQKRISRLRSLAAEKPKESQPGPQ